MPLLVETPYPSGSLEMTVRLDDGATPTVTYNDDGSFSFPLDTPGQTYKLAIEQAGAIQELQHTATRITLVERLAGRPDRVPVTQPTTINFGSALPLAVGSSLRQVCGRSPAPVSRVRRTSVIAGTMPDR